MTGDADLTAWLAPRAAWMVVAVAPGRELPPALRRLLADPCPSDLAFRATHHLTTAGHPGMHLAAWADTGLPGAAGHPSVGLPWHHDDRGTTVVTGRWRSHGRGWPAAGEAAAEFAAALQASSPERLPVESVGSFAAVHLHAGRALVIPDALGFGFAYAGADRDVQVAASRPELVARALAGTATPVRDVLNSANLAHTPHQFGETTGFVGVRLLRPGAIASLSRDGLAVTERDLRGLAEAVVGDRPLRPDDLADVVLDAVVDELVAACALPCAEPTIDLTGGKDSRALLGCVLESGLADRFTFRTSGPPDLADVRVAGELATRFGLRHESGLFGHAPGTSFAERAHAFLRATSGGVNAWFTKTPRAGAPEVRVSGLSGECLRVHHPIRGRDLDLDGVIRHVADRFRAGTLPLLRPDVAAELDGRFESEVARVGDRSTHPLDALAFFNIGNRARTARGPMDELEGDIRITPLATPRTVGAAVALDVVLRQDELIHHRLTSRAHPALAEHPFASGGWSEGLSQQRRDEPGSRAREPHVRDTRARAVAAGASRSTGTPVGSSGTAASPADGGPAAGPPDRPGGGGKAESLSARIHRSRGSERSEFLRSAFADRGSAMWELLDRDVAMAAADDFDRLTVKQRRQVFGAATAVLWTAGPDGG